MKSWLDRKTYLALCRRGWQAVAASIDADGTVHNICVGTMSSEDVNYYLDRPKVNDDSHGIIGLLFRGHSNGPPAEKQTIEANEEIYWERNIDMLFAGNCTCSKSQTVQLNNDAIKSCNGTVPRRVGNCNR